MKVAVQVIDQKDRGVATAARSELGRVATVVEMIAATAFWDMKVA